MGALNVLELLSNVLKIPKAQLRPAVDAGYKNLVYRAVGDIGNPPLNPRINANVGTHSDLAGGAQARQIKEFMEEAGLPNPGVLTLLARARRPLFMTDEEVNIPAFIAEVLKDRKLEGRINRAKEKFPDRKLEIPGVGDYDDNFLALEKVLNRRAAEAALRGRGYDAVVYPNYVEGNFEGFDPRFVSRGVLSSLAAREDLARSILGHNPVPSYDSLIVQKINPSLSVLDYSNYRDPFGELMKKRDFTSVGYCTGGRVN